MSFVYFYRMGHHGSYMKGNGSLLEWVNGSWVTLSDPSSALQFYDLEQCHMPGIVRVTSLTILGVTMTNGLSASDHVRGIISDCAQTLYALGVLRAYGMSDMALQAWPSTNRSSSPNYCTPPVLRRDLLQRPMDSESTRRILTPQHPLRLLSFRHSAIRRTA